MATTSSMKVTMGVRFLVAFHACFIFFPAVSQTTPELKFHKGSVWVTGLASKASFVNFSSITDEQWAAIFRVYTHDAWAKRINQPIAGTYTWYGDNLSFKPNFTFAPGQRYHCVFAYPTFLANAGNKQASPEKLNKLLEISFSIPEEKTSPTSIEDVHPQAQVLPENMLRMYISFSSPMMPGEAYDHITLLTENGTRIEKAFLIIDQELWDAERKRFTLLFDPGRVKRGIQSNVELGSPLQAGQTYRLVIDSNWRDASGNALSASYTKTFTVSSAERTKLSMKNWKITAPEAGTHDKLLIEFDRPIDNALAMKCISISTSRCSKVRGEATLIEGRRWLFTPAQAWPQDQYYLEVLPYLEDVAGNNFNNAFDIDLSKEKRENSTEAIRISFSIRPLAK